MDEALQLSALIGAIYDAALKPDEWRGVLAMICQYVGGSGAMIFWHDSVFLTGVRFHSWGDDPAFTKLYFDSYIELNPTASSQNNVPVGTATAISSLIGFADLRQTRFFKEWMQPQRYVDNVFANLYRSATGAASFAVARDVRDGMVDAESLRRMQLLVPHVQRAVLIGKIIDAQRSENAMFRQLVDSVAASIFLLDGQGAILHHNQSADRMLDDGDLISKRNGHPSLDRGLAHHIRKFLTFTRDRRSAADRRSLVVTGRSGKDYLLELLSLDYGSRPALPDVIDAVGALIIRHAAIDTGAGLALLAQRFHLTPREIDVLRGVAQIGGVPEVAIREGISARTVKAHLHSVFAKTGTDRQADLVQLLASFSAPF